MRRRPLLRVAGIAAVGTLAGCTDRLGGGSSTPTRDPSRVTTTAGQDVTIRSSRVEFPEEGGPSVDYQLGNEGSTDATVEVRTVLSIEGGGNYEQTAVADVPAGGEVSVGYRIVEYSALPNGAAEEVRRGRGTYEVYLNGEQRGGL